MYDRPVQLRICCDNIRHKLMYVDERHDHPGFIDAESDTRIYWCVKTQESLGPDREPVHPDACTPGRSCYCRTAHLSASAR